MIVAIRIAPGDYQINIGPAIFYLEHSVDGKVRLLCPKGGTMIFKIITRLAVGAAIVSCGVAAILIAAIIETS